MTIKETIVNEITENVVKALRSIGVNDNTVAVEIPPSKEMGNLAFPMFKYASILKKSPNQIASDVNDKLEVSSFIGKSEVKGPYLNVFYNIKSIALKLFPQILEKNENFGRQKNKNEKMIVEFSSPNTNKPLHLGHCRNNVIGDAISRTLEFAGYDVIKLNLINDRGIHICKSMLAYKKFGGSTTPEKENKKSDHLVGDFYVKFAKEADKDKSLEDEAQNMLQMWEKDDKETIELWKLINKWAIDGINKTYKRMDIEFDEYEYESINYLYGKDIVNEGLGKQVFYKESDDSIWINNEDQGLDKKVVLRADGTSVYITQDLGTATKRHEKHQFDDMIYVVGSEQEYHFKTLFVILKKLGYDWADNCKHLSYGMVNLPDGKMKSREGTVVDADNLMDLLYDMSSGVIEEKNRELSGEEKREIANKISLAALKYYLLNFSPKKDILFIPEKSISFDGNTGPYLQYTTARLNSLFSKNTNMITYENDFITGYKLNDDEENVVLQLLDFEDSITRAVENLSPYEICNVLYNTARMYNKFYHDNSILRAGDEKLVNLRLVLSKAVMIVLNNGMNLLGVEPLEKM